MKNIMKLSALAVLVALATGCASNNALTTAQRAEQKANEALAVANEAKAMSMATEEKVDRAFRRGQYK